MASLLQATYDLVTHPSFAHPRSHSDRLATVAKLFGMNPAPVENCRVLELGCASGGNLIPMAACLPASQFVGIDFSPRQIANGQEVVTALELRNIRLETRDFHEIPSDFGAFDYVIAHGVYSWVSSGVQSTILSVCKQCLGPDGVAFVSYATYPGCHSRRAIREMMQYRTSRISDPHERATQARALLSFLDDSMRGSNHGYATMVREERPRIQVQPDAVLLHNDLEEDYNPVYFTEFMDRATRAGLKFLEETDINSSLFPRFPPEVLETISQPDDDQIRREQYADFLGNRAIRETLLCHDHIRLSREIKPEHLRRFRLASRALTTASGPDIRSDKVVVFQSPHGSPFATSHPLTKAALDHLAKSWPQSVPFESVQAAAHDQLTPRSIPIQHEGSLDQDSEQLMDGLLQALAAGVIEIHVHAPKVTAEPGARPLARPLARLQARAGSMVTNLYHEVVRLDDVARFLLCLMDGSRNRSQLVQELTRHVAERGLIVQQHGRSITDDSQLRRVLGNGLEMNLHSLARLALLVE